jgi:serine/threonine protein phosphatase 1
MPQRHRASVGSFDIAANMGLGAAMLFQRFFQKHPAPVPAPQAPRAFGVPEGMRVYAVGDIHGRSGLLEKMLEAIARDASEHKGVQVVEVFLGDYIDRGMHSRAVIDQLLAPSPNGHQRICLLGNHEETLLNFLADPTQLRQWANFGGYATLASYGIPIPASMNAETMVALRDQLRQNLPPAHVDFLQQLQLTYQLGDYLFVHAGILPEQPLEKQSRANVLWIRNAFLNYTGYFDYYVVHGHSPVAEPDIRTNRANLDVSGAPVESLCCLVMQGTQRRPLVVTT